MKKRNLVSTLLAGLLAVIMCVSLAACNSSNNSSNNSTPPANEDDKQEESQAVQQEEQNAPEAVGGVYTATTDNFESWDYSFTNINAFGDTAGVGMLNIQSWGNKKLALGDDGTCDGVGCSWTIQLDVDGDK